MNLQGFNKFLSKECRVFQFVDFILYCGIQDQLQCSVFHPCFLRATKVMMLCQYPVLLQPARGYTYTNAQE